MLGVGRIAGSGYLAAEYRCIFQRSASQFYRGYRCLIYSGDYRTFAGYLPARRAMQIKAIEAIRDEKINSIKIIFQTNSYMKKILK